MLIYMCGIALTLRPTAKWRESISRFLRLDTVKAMRDPGQGRQETTPTLHNALFLYRAGGNFHT
jgi:hypothetical protein